MKKGIGIVFMLTLVVVLASVGVFFVERITTPIIEERQIKEVQEAVSEVFPEIVGTTWTVEEATFELESPITGAQVIKDEDTLMGIVYTVSFQGFANSFNYVVGVNRDGEVTGYKTLKNNETASSAGEFDDPATFEAIKGALLGAASSSFDGVSGATYTSDYWKTSIDQVAAWHADADIFPEIPEIEIAAALIKSKLADDTLVVTELDADAKAKLSDSGIDVAYEAKGESGDYVVYIETYSSYEPGTTVFLAVDSESHETVLFDVIDNNDTEGIGRKILEQDYTQLEDESLNTLINGDFDSISGATVTSDAWKDAMYRIAAFHQEVYQDIITYSTDELIPEYNKQLSPVELGGMTTWDIYSEDGIKLKTSNDGSGLLVTWDNPGTDYRSIEISQDGFNFVAGKKYSVVVVAHSDSGKEMILTLNDGTTDILQTRLVTEGVQEDLRDNTFNYTITPTENIDDVSLTLGLGKTVAKEEEGDITIVEVRIVELTGEFDVPDNATNQVKNSFLHTTRVIEVTEQKFTNVNISNIFDIMNDKGEVEGTIYYGYTFGAYVDGPTMIRFMVGIDKDGNYTGFRFLSTNDPAVNPSEIYTANYDDFNETGYFAEELEGLLSTNPVDLPDYDGLALQVTSIENALNEIGRYHDEDYSKRFNESIPQAELEAAFPGAVSFVEIYNDYDFQQGVVNVYEAYDNDNTLIGYVYAGKYKGLNSDILYTIGINNAGTTVELNVYSQKETWIGAGKSTNFIDSTFILEFDGLDVTNFVTNYTPNADPTSGGTSTDVDAISGVSTTTGGDGVHFGLIDSIYTALKFHTDNSVGGAS